jgi:hypothetical protein
VFYSNQKRYELVDDNGVYRWCAKIGNKIMNVVYSCQKVAIGYDRQGYVVLCHGSVNTVKKRINNMKKRYLEGGFDLMAGNLDVVVFSDIKDMSKFNEIFQVSGKLKDFLTN